MAPTTTKISRFKTREEVQAYINKGQYWPKELTSLSPQAVSTLLLQVTTLLPKSAKTPSNILHAIAKVIYEGDWNHLADTIANCIATQLTQSNPCDAAAASIWEESTTLGFAIASYANMVANAAAPHAQAIANGEQQDW
ncbi:hypothetical protein BDQ17DRAFT_1432774 [Cyathus striatus]|nr:hypothetical protein BDQ17DRAFT_1432774 [Cyathus striatus]